MKNSSCGSDSQKNKFIGNMCIKYFPQKETRPMGIARITVRDKKE